MLINKGAITGSTVHVVPVEGAYWLLTRSAICS